MNFNFIFKTIYKKNHRKKPENDSTHIKLSRVTDWLSLII